MHIKGLRKHLQVFQCPSFCVGKKMSALTDFSFEEINNSNIKHARWVNLVGNIF